MPSSSAETAFDKKCAACGFGNRAAARFCGNCGTPWDVLVGKKKAAAAGRWRLVIAAAAAVLVLGAVGYFKTGLGPAASAYFADARAKREQQRRDAAAAALDQAQFEADSKRAAAIGIQWVSIPGGAFAMGSADPDLAYARPVHPEKVKSFEMTQSPVTFGQYKKCVEAGACAPAHVSDGACNSFDGTEWKTGNLPASFQGDAQPAVCVDWEQARAFSAWIGGRLPSEAEWEYAARGAGKDRKYPWGDEAATCARAVVYDGGAGCGKNSTWAVCSKPAGKTPQGLCDMAGNAAQWTADRYADSYGAAPAEDGAGRVARGGSWASDAGDARSANRGGQPPATRASYLGFRAARYPTAAENAQAAADERARGEAEALAQQKAEAEGRAREAAEAAAQAESSARAAAAAQARAAAASRDAEADANAKRAGIRWVSIPGGTFVMGAENAYMMHQSWPPHRVAVKPFEMAKTLVTFGQYNQCVTAGVCTPPHMSRGECFGIGWAENLPDSFRGANQPVVCVDWEQARTFSDWVGGRLPSEAEWEYAARGAGKEWLFPWGDEKATCRRAVISGCGKTTAPVCSKPAGNTPQGLCDMAGNAEEWVQDSFHDSYIGAPTDGSAREDGSPTRARRGGSWRAEAEMARSAHRYGGSETLDETLGFRPAR
jgi:formylglycine-generating enzyme required for sulfatase activity